MGFFKCEEKPKNVTNYRIKDPRVDLEWFNSPGYPNVQPIKDSRQDGVRMWYNEMIKYGRIPKAHCLKFNGKYYCPGAIFKLNKKWAQEHGILTMLPMHCGPNYDDYINQESLYLEYTFNRYAKNGYVSFSRRWFPFVDMSEWSNRTKSTIANFYDVDEFINYYNVKQSFRENVDVIIKLTEIENALQLIDGYEWNLERFPEINNNKITENKVALIIYVTAMLGSLIFKEPYGLWFIFTIAYLGFSQSMKDRYGGEK